MIRFIIRLCLAVPILAALAYTQTGIFRIQPVRPLAELRDEAAKAQPPRESGDFLPSDLVDLTTLHPAIRLDIRYATADNFLGAPVYTQARAFLQRPAAEALKRAHLRLMESGYGLLIHDGYRPWAITKLFWDMTSGYQREFVADPATGSKHNRGCAVDLTIYDLTTGVAVQMPGDYDEMTPRSYPDYTGGPPEARAKRDLLRKVMEAEGFTVEPNEWWHYNYKDWRDYPITDIPFSAIGK
jgi:D-alanyl-D-alanine dipeptidase